MKKLLIISVLSILFNYDAFSTHAAGMDISYQCISQGTNSDTYKIILKFYRDCDGIPAPSNLTLSYSSSCGSGSATLYQVGSAVDINPLCASYCNGGNAFGIEEYTYEATVTLSHCSNWVLSVCECCRNNAINTINNPGGAQLCVEATLNNTVYCNNSPTFSEYPTPFLCAGSYFCYNNGAIEIDGDSLVYSLVTPLDNPGTVTYIGGYSSTNPVGGGSTFDPITGNLCVTPPGIVSGVLAIKVSEYRNGILIGSIIRDIQINVFACTSVNPPQLSGIDTNVVVDMTNINTYTVEVNCPNGSQNINFDINTINNNPPPPPPPPGVNITVTINTDYYGNEITWTITNLSGVVVASGGPYATGANTYTVTACVPTGTLNFNWYDSYGDGWNWAGIQGSYSVTQGSATLTSGSPSSGSSGSSTFYLSGGAPCTPTSGAGSLVTMNWNNGIPGANFTIANNNTMNPIGTFNWNPTLADTANSPYFFTVNVTNDACPAPGSFSFQYQIIVTGTDMVATPTITNISCNGGNDGVISMSTTGASPPFTYLWPNGGTTANASSLTAGTYNLQLTDGGGCTMTETYTVIEPSQITSTSSFYDASCLNINDGSATVFPSNGTPGYTYLWDDANTQTTQTATSLANGTYICTITDSNSCIFMDTVNIGLAPAYNTTIISTNPACNGNTGTAIVLVQAPSAGVSNLTYCTSTPGASTNSTIDNVQLTGDTFSINNNTTGACDQYEDYTNQYADITQGQSYTIDVTLGDCSNNYPSGGKVYIDWNIDGDFNDPGEEIGTIPDGPPSTTTTISFTVPFSVFGATKMRIVSQFLNNTPVSSIGPCDVGVMANPVYIQPWFGATEDYSIVVNGGLVNATYLWSNGQTTDSISGLLPGGYSVLVTVPNGCTLTEYTNITEPPAISTITSQNNISCFGSSDGNISLTINGGIPDYTINAAGYSQTLVGGVSLFTTPSLLPAGTYPYTVTDSNNCVYTDSITLTSPNQISTTEITNNVSCNGLSDGSVVLTINGGTPNYSEDWGLNNPLALSAGIANYQITDNNGCVYSDSVIITEPVLLTTTFTQINVSTCSAADGSIDVTIAGGTTPYTFSWSSGQNTEDLTSISGGTYILTVMDSKGCISIQSVTIMEPPSPSLSYTQIDVNCNGGNDGSIDLNVNGGTFPFSYIWTNGEITEDITGLIAGQYSVQVSDDNACLENITITITEPIAPSISATQINVDCNGNSTGSIDLTIVGSSLSYATLWSSGQVTEDINNLLAGNYTYTITDANACIYSNTINISQPNVLEITPTIVNVNCKDESNGYIILNTSGGTTPYIEDFGPANPAALAAGNYPFTITDNNACIYTSNITISEPDSLLVSATSTNASCGGYFDGTATLVVTGGTPTYNSNWGLSNPNGLNAGTHTYIVNDDNNCISQGSVTITEPPAMQIIVDTFRVSCFGLSDGSANLTISAGAGAPYIEDWGGLNPNSMSAGLHIITVTDVNNCSAQVTVIITEPTDIQINPLLSHVSCFGENNGTAFLQISGGIPPYSQNWNGVNILSLTAGSYLYSVLDNNNCVKNNFITINEPDTLRATATITNANCFNSDDGKIYLTITGGTAPYTEDFGGFNPFALGAGSYNFSVTDVKGCQFDSIAVVEQANQVLLSFSAESPICRNDSTEITITISNPLHNIYTIIIEDSIQKSFVIDSLGNLIPEGIKLKLSPNFTSDLILLSITDENGCESNASDTAKVIVNQFPILDLSLTDICEGTPPFFINEGIPSGGNYFINGEATNFFDVENLDYGNYVIGYVYTDPLTNCSNAIEKTISINPSPKADFTFSPQPADIDEPNILFISGSEEIENSSWDLGDGTIIVDELSFWHTYADTGKYEITYLVNNQFNCTDTLRATLIINPVYQIFIPNSFTPNDDGDNDTFQPYVNGANKYTITIFDRWGEIIFQKEHGVWDGTLNGTKVQDGVYTYSILVNDFKDKPFAYSGIITLLK